MMVFQIAVSAAPQKSVRADTVPTASTRPQQILSTAAPSISDSKGIGSGHGVGAPVERADAPVGPTQPSAVDRPTSAPAANSVAATTHSYTSSSGKGYWCSAVLYL